MTSLAAQQNKTQIRHEAAVSADCYAIQGAAALCSCGGQERRVRKDLLLPAVPRYEYCSSEDRFTVMKKAETRRETPDIIIMFMRKIIIHIFSCMTDYRRGLEW
jgi:hypothetical protein